jgi:hypothetical protein
MLQFADSQITMFGASKTLVVSVFGLLGEALDEVILHELVLHLAVSVKD